MMFRLPRLNISVAIVSTKTGNPSPQFLQFWNNKVVPSIEEQEQKQDAAQAAIEAVQADQAAQLVLIKSALEQITLTQAAAAQAQATADVANSTTGGTSTAVSGSSTQTLNLTSTSFTLAVSVNLTGVVAGTLELTGSGPVNSSGTTSNGLTPGQFEVREWNGTTETVVYPTSGTATFDVEGEPGSPSTVTNNSPPSGTTSRSSTGALTYRLYVRKVSGANVTNLKVFLYARRA